MSASWSPPPVKPSRVGRAASTGIRAASLLPGGEPGRKKMWRWLGKGAWALLDQGLYGASNLLTNLLLARWLGVSEYGAFAFAFAGLIFVLSLFNALLVEPMLVFGSGRYRSRFQTYLGALLYAKGGFSATVCLLLLGAGAVLSMQGAPLLAEAFVGLGVMAPFFLLSWLTRQACYAIQRPDLSTLGGAVHLMLTLLGLGLLFMTGTLGLFAVFCVSGGAGLVAGLVLLYRLRPEGRRAVVAPMMREIVRVHWEYGRWATAARIPMRVSGSVVLLALPLWGGLAATGTFKALTNFTMPLIQLQAALGTLLLSVLVRARESTRFIPLVLMMLGLFTLFSAAYALPLGLFHNDVIGWVYGGKYAEAGALLWLLGLQLLFAGASEVLATTLRACEQPARIFWAYSVSAGAGLPCMLLLIAWLGLTGAVLGTVLLSLFNALALGFSLLRLPDVSLRTGQQSPVGRPSSATAPTASGLP